MLTVLVAVHALADEPLVRTALPGSHHWVVTTPSGTALSTLEFIALTGRLDHLDRYKQLRNRRKSFALAFAGVGAGLVGGGVGQVRWSQAHGYYEDSQIGFLMMLGGVSIGALALAPLDGLAGQKNPDRFFDAETADVLIREYNARPVQP